MKIYYLKQEVKIGDKVIIYNVDVEITQYIINNNPNLFTVEESEIKVIPEYVKCIKGESDCSYNIIGKIYPVDNYSYEDERLYIENDPVPICNIDLSVDTVNEGRNIDYKSATQQDWDNQTLLDEAKEKYPIETKFKSALIDNNCYKVDNSYIGFYHNGDIIVNDPTGPSIYHNGKWAKKYLFTTEDEVDIYEGDESTAVRKKQMQIVSTCNYDGDGSDALLYFSTKGAAEYYVAKHKEKNLGDYEAPLFTTNGIYYRSFRWLKSHEPKLYYTKVLQLIADDLNGDWKPNFSNIDNKYQIDFTRKTCNIHCGGDEGCIYFKTEELVNKAITLLGDKINEF